MKAKRIIPCLDIYQGRVVKGVNFVNLKDAGNPIEIASAYDEAGADELVFLDISGTSEGRNIMIDLIRSMAKHINIPFTVGGGIRTVDDIANVLKEGAAKVSISSAAFNRPELISEAFDKFGSESIVVAIDAKKKESNDGWEVYINGGSKNTGKDVVEWALEVEERGAGEILLTSMDCDGTKEGYDIDLTYEVASKVNIPVIASGGAGKLEHFYNAVTQGKADAILAASLFHYKEVEIKDVKQYLKDRKININFKQQKVGEGMEFIKQLKFDDNGLVPAIIQDYKTGVVLMMAHMSKESIQQTISTGKTVFWSRSRKKLWIKGEESGHYQYVKSINIDCDGDCLLIQVEQIVAACHTNNYTCFYRQYDNKQVDNKQIKEDIPNTFNKGEVLQRVYDVIQDRVNNPKEGSYTNYLFEKGLDKILKKVGEESAEVIIAAKNEDAGEIKYEVSDLLYHLLVLLVEQKVTLDDIYEELKGRM